MPTFLFDQTIFGPVISRRLGVSLGINLLPNDSKLCSFDCIYCECGWNPEKGTVKAIFPSRAKVARLLREKLEEMKSNGTLPDVITFAGNGEPTLHPSFDTILDDTIQLRKEICPNARIAVLSNSTTLHKSRVVEALKRVDQPVGRFILPAVVENLKQFDGELIIQTMFLRGTFKGMPIDNTTEPELLAWIELLLKIRPKSVMIYTVARDTPAKDLHKVSVADLEKIAGRVRNKTGLEVQVSG